MNTSNITFTSNRVADIERCYAEQLAGLYPEGEIRMFVRMLFEAFLSWNQVDLLTRRNETVNQSDLLSFHWALHDLKRFRPIQHIVGYADFLDCRIAVDEDTLIPRPETEEMVQLIIDSFNKRNIIPHRILDLCTGSGCIAIALAKQWPNASVVGLDVSEKAIAVAKRNAVANNVEVEFVQADINDYAIHGTEFDIIVSNPPYVMEKERSSMSRNVLDWEPSNALFVPDSDPLLFYRSIARIASESLKPQGLLMVEINEKLGEETLQLFGQHHLKGEVLRDFRNKDRFIKGNI